MAEQGTVTQSRSPRPLLAGGLVLAGLVLGGFHVLHGKGMAVAGIVAVIIAVAWFTARRASKRGVRLSYRRSVSRGGTGGGRASRSGRSRRHGSGPHSRGGRLFHSRGGGGRLFHGRGGGLRRRHAGKTHGLVPRRSRAGSSPRHRPGRAGSRAGSSVRAGTGRRAGPGMGSRARGRGHARPGPARTGGRPNRLGVSGRRSGGKGRGLGSSRRSRPLSSGHRARRRSGLTSPARPGRAAHRGVLPRLGHSRRGTGPGRSAKLPGPRWARHRSRRASAGNVSRGRSPGPRRPGLAKPTGNRWHRRRHAAASSPPTRAAGRRRTSPPPVPGPRPRWWHPHQRRRWRHAARLRQAWRAGAAHGRARSRAGQRLPSVLPPALPHTPGPAATLPSGHQPRPAMHLVASNGQPVIGRPRVRRHHMTDAPTHPEVVQVGDALDRLAGANLTEGGFDSFARSVTALPEMLGDALSALARQIDGHPGISSNYAAALNDAASVIAGTTNVLEHAYAVHVTDHAPHQD